MFIFTNRIHEICKIPFFFFFFERITVFLLGTIFTTSVEVSGI